MLPLLVVIAVLLATLLTATLMTAAEEANTAHARTRARLGDEGGFGR